MGFGVFFGSGGSGGGGTGDVSGPASAVSGNLASFNGTGGKTIQDSGIASSTFVNGSKTYAVFSPLDNQAPSASFATLTTRNNIALLGFDDAADENAIFVNALPEGASVGSGLTVNIKWAAASATTGNVVWVVAFMAMDATTDIDSDSFDTSATATTATLGTSGFTQTTSITITTIDSLVAGVAYRLKVTRNADDAADTMAGDAQVSAVEVRSAA